MKFALLQNLLAPSKRLFWIRLWPAQVRYPSVTRPHWRTCAAVKVRVDSTWPVEGGSQQVILLRCNTTDAIAQSQSYSLRIGAHFADICVKKKI